MISYHHIKSIEAEKNLLQKIISLEETIRKQKDESRKRKIAQSEKYTGVFKPITDSIYSLSKNENNTDEVIKDDNPILEKDEFEEKPVKTENIYSSVLEKIPKRSLDDGIFGLDSGKRQVTGRHYSVENDELTVFNEDGTVNKIRIDDPNVWYILLSQNPSKVVNLTSNEGKDAVEKYRKIVDELKLLERAEYTNKNYKKRAKYKLLGNKGEGFLFSTRRPRFMNTVVIPSNDDELLRSLIQNLAELRAGDENARNIVVPLANTAKKRGILPQGLLTPEELTWIYA